METGRLIAWGGLVLRTEIQFLLRRVSWRCVALFLFAGFSSTGQTAFEFAGDVVDTTTTGTTAEFALSSGGIARIDVLDEAIVRVRVNPTGTLSLRVSPAISATNLSPPANSVFDTGEVVWIVTQRLSIAVLKQPFRIIALHADGSLMSADVEPGVLWDPVDGTIVSRKYLPPDEAIMGLGLLGGPINRRGLSINMRNTDNFVLNEYSAPLYQSYPLYYGIRNGKPYGLFLDSPAYPFFDVANAEPGILSLGAAEGELNYYLLAGEDPQDIANAYSRLTGFNPLPPKWTLGYHHSRYGWSTAQEISQIAGELRVRGFPADSIWFDILYMQNLRKFTWDPVGFPSPIQMHIDLLGSGFKSVYIDEPLVRDDDPLWPFLDASEYFVKDVGGGSHLNTIWFGNVSWIDYTKPETSAWYKEQLKVFMSTGITAIWNDLNEPADNFMPRAVFDFGGDPRTETEARNLYALFANRTSWEAQRELRPNTRPWNLSRSGYSGIQRYASNWGGDGASSWDSLSAAIQMSISMGISGQNHFGHDIGGFLGSPDAELFTRWVEFALFTPFFRNHSVNTSAPREPWLYGEPHTSRIRALFRWRYRLLPYLYTLFEEASRSGRPILMPTFFYAENDSATYDQNDVFLLGPGFLVAPVHEPGAVDRELYLPAGGQWINYYSDELLDGGQVVTVPAPLGQLPLFVRHGAIIPYGGDRNYVDDPGADPTLTVHFYPSGNRDRFVLYEDDGATFDFESGEYLRTLLEIERSVKLFTLSIARLDGNYQTPDRDWILQVHRQMVHPTSITVQGAPLTEYAGAAELETATRGWFYDATAAIVHLKLPDNEPFQIVVAQF
jgi:alpha-glucosidase